MWRTEVGNRVLKGAEAALFLECLGDLWTGIELCAEIEEEHRVGVKVFDSLTTGQKLSMLVNAGEALIDPAIPAPRLTAVNEATVAAVFNQLRINLEVQFYDPECGYDLRPTVLAASRAVDEAGIMIDELPSEKCDNQEDWEFCVSFLEDQILWDVDWADDAVLDDPPEKRDVLLALMRIDDDYYTAVAPDPSATEYEELAKRLGEVISPTTL